MKSTDEAGNVTEYNSDGVYRLWFSKSGDEPGKTTPTLELLNLTLPPIVGSNGTHISFWGNLQHWADTYGSWYIDDVIVSESFNGSVPYTRTDKAAPMPPTMQN